MINNGVPATAANFNAAFISRTQDSATIGVVTLNNTSEPESGDPITNAQRAVNELFDADGTAGENDPNRKVYASTNYVTNGSSRKTAIEQLDAALYAVANTTATFGAPELEIRTLTSGEITAKEIVLANPPLVPSNTSFYVKGMPTQIYGIDFTITGNILSWSGTDLDGVLLAGDVVKVSYWLTPSADVEIRTITSGEDTAKEIVLAAVPINASTVSFDVQGMPSQFFSLDYTVTGNILSWNGLGLDGIISAGDVVRVLYWS